MPVTSRPALPVAQTGTRSKASPRLDAAVLRLGPTQCLALDKMTSRNHEILSRFMIGCPLVIVFVRTLTMSCFVPLVNWAIPFESLGRPCEGSKRLG